jgi:enoyl-CoA hydratase
VGNGKPEVEDQKKRARSGEREVEENIMSSSKPTSSGADLKVSKEGNIGRIIFNNPTKMNAMTLSMWSMLNDAMIRFGEDPDIRVIVLSGQGDKAFVSGADISEFDSHRSNPQTTKYYNRISEEASQAVVDQKKPVIAKIEGYCVGGGMGIALSCDIRICSNNSRMGIPAAKLGLGYNYAGVKLLYDVVGPAVASEVLFSARLFYADEAVQMGLVNHAVDVEELDKTVEDLAQKIAHNAPLTISAAKAAIRTCSLPESDRNLDRLLTQVNQCFDSLDYAEGRKAFAEKRKPVFEGK